MIELSRITPADRTVIHLQHLLCETPAVAEAIHEPAVVPERLAQVDDVRCVLSGVVRVEIDVGRDQVVATAVRRGLRPFDTVRPRLRAVQREAVEGLAIQSRFGSTGAPLVDEHERPGRSAKAEAVIEDR